MTDDGQSLDENTDDEGGRQPDRKREEERDRDREDEPVAGDPDRRLGELDAGLETQEYPTTTNQLVEAYGDYDIETRDGTRSLNGVLASSDDQTFVSADDVRNRILGLIHR
ncbi:DUF5789 family protein [Halorubrum aquaticum]|uniref:DUF5789 family protein n=1 Tax=Halorubrum aquaticum TaxID=387340 RepID=UPI00122CBCD2|nr:hypothetical protein [Halorubrum aquaticum]